MWKKSSPFLPKRNYYMKKKLNYCQRECVLNHQTFTLRLMKYRDIKELLQIERELYEGKTPWGRSAFLFELKGPYPSLYLVVESQGRVVAFGGCRFNQMNGHITNLAVQTDYQRLGIGSLLLTEIRNVAFICQCQSLSLETPKSNMDAQRLYRKFGFVARNIKKNYYDHDDAVLMICLLRR